MQTRFFTELTPEDTRVPESPQEICFYGKSFSIWADELVAENSGSLVKINQAKVLLVDRYFEWRAYVPKNHRNRVSERSHLCIWHIFELTHRKLRLAELAQTGPLLFLPPEQSGVASAPMAQIPALFLGDVEE
jgi:hypothetical protein